MNEEEIKQEEQKSAEEQAETTAPEKEEVVVELDKNGKPKKTVKQEIIEWVVTILAAVAIALVIRTVLFEPVKVDGHSMDYTLADGEVMLVTKPEYIFGQPQRFDIIICHYPDRGNTNFVKRIVGLPGDEVQIKMDGYLYVNGEKYEEEYLVNRPNYFMTQPYTVPEGKYFVLGDNRSNSNDSHIIGPIDRNMIVGHVRAVFFPFSKARWTTGD